MNTTNTVLTAGKALLTLIESDLLIDAGPALATFGQQIVASNGDKLKQAAAVVQLQGALIGAAPSALGGLESELASIVVSKVQQLVSTAQANQSAALAALGAPPAAAATTPIA